MANLLHATTFASYAGLSKSLELSAASCECSTTETLLGAVIRRFPDAARPEIVRALNCAVHAHNWKTASYLADYLANTKRNEGDVDTIPEIVRCLRHSGVKHKEVRDSAVLFNQVNPRNMAVIDQRLSFNMGQPDASSLLLLGRKDLVVPPGTILVRFDIPTAYAGEYRLRTTGTRESLAKALSGQICEIAAQLEPGTYQHDPADLHLAQIRPLPLAPIGRRFVADIVVPKF